MTSNAQEFVKVITFESLLGKKVKSNLFTESKKNIIISNSNDAEIILVAPCTANFIQNFNGVADDLATGYACLK